MYKNTHLIGKDSAVVNQILPHKEKWAWDLYLKGRANNWMPNDISMGKDIEQWRSNKLSEDERHIVRMVMGFFAGSESLVANNLLVNIYRWICDPECRTYLGHQHSEELNHNFTVVYICESLNLNPREIYNAYAEISSIKAKDQFLMDICRDINRPDFNIESDEGKRELLRNIITYYILCESMFFYSSFAALLSFSRRNLMPGLTEQITYTLKDEGLHIEFGINLIKRIREDYPNLWDEKFEEETKTHIIKTCELEIAFAKEAIPNGIMGLNSKMFMDYLYYLGNRRCEQIGLPLLFKETINPFPWLMEVTDLPKMKNFFETRVQEYSKSNLIDDLD